ncbi:lamin tail domain-containing protein [Chryseobacterium sp. G0162]|uniref:lamin tail domain-containing protein n=1 Tax=unclassified Chryseobacterium TaxID=2593645 RepID=UPI000F4EBF5B|nr:MULTISPECIES: lamin tail domain-containing protein [unclassified Chryseobacterium]AZB10820.1 lamin tail domain-containing protein [Chryseobacterium sp. G0162]
MKNPENVAPFVEASELITELKDKANDILSSVLSTELSSITINGKGNFPYYWQDPSNLKFNKKTYDWISSNLKANTEPVQLDQVFTNYFIDVFSKVNYSLSEEDTVILNDAHKNATDQQMALLNAWVGAYGSLPPATETMQPIDIIMNKIATEWANPATTLSQIQKSDNLDALLNKTPASGQPILPVLANYLNALGATISLQNNVTMNNGYLSRVLKNVQQPKKDNGGLQLNDDSVLPAFQVTTPLSDILNGLKNTSQAAQIDMEVKRESESRFQVSVQGKTGFSIPIFDFFTLGIGGNANYFSEDIAISKNSIKISMSFTGVTLVNFGPTDFNIASNMYWAWFDPIRKAEVNSADKEKEKHISGYKFSPNPATKFGPDGPFGLLNGVAISNYPSVEITVTGEDYKSIQKTFEQSSSATLSFLGIPLASVTESTYSSSIQVDSSKSTIKITLTPPQSLIAGNNRDSIAWVLGAIVDYPAQVNSEREMLEKGAYPNYQLYKDNTGTTYCSGSKVKSHDVGSAWVSKCLAAHPGTSCSGKPWTSPSQKGTVWP